MADPLRISIFNHKGGVGKTTLTANIACALAARRKRVLLVDADPQCNLTSYFIEDSVVDDLLDKSDSSEGSTLWSVVRPLVQLDGPPSLIEPIELSIDNVFLLPGDIRLSEFEEVLGESWTDCFRRRQKGFLTSCAISNLIRTISESHSIDYVFYDTGPNIGPLNRIVLLDCNFFIVPVACDLFSLRALKTLGHALSKWISDWSTITMLAPDDVTLLAGSPVFLGYIPQQFRVYRGEPTKTSKFKMPGLDAKVSSEVAARLREVDPDLAPGKPMGSKLGQVKQFSLASDAQRDGVPMWSVRGADVRQIEDAKQAFLEIADELIRRTR